MDILPHEKPIYALEKEVNRLASKGEKKKKGKAGAVKTRKNSKDLEAKLKKVKKEVYSHLTPWDRVLICRHPERPHTQHYIHNLCDSFLELSGDRLYGEDKAIIGGLAQIDGKPFMVIGQEKGHDTESRVRHSFGMPHPEGFRKAFRLMKLAEKFQIPVVTFIDTAGAYAGLSAEERGIGWAIAENLKGMALLKTPIIIVVIGEGCSGGALGIGVGDSIAMLEHAYYTVISPEGCASILWKDAAKKDLAAQVLKLNSDNLLAYKLIDEVLKEPEGGAHHDPKSAFQAVKKFILKEEAKLSKLSTEALLSKRYEKFRCMGKFFEKKD